MMARTPEGRGSCPLWGTLSDRTICLPLRHESKWSGSRHQSSVWGALGCAACHERLSLTRFASSGSRKLSVLPEPVPAVTTQCLPCNELRSIRAWWVLSLAPWGNKPQPKNSLAADASASVKPGMSPASRSVMAAVETYRGNGSIHGSPHKDPVSLSRRSRSAQPTEIEWQMPYVYSAKNCP